MACYHAKRQALNFFVMHLHPGHWEIRHQEVDVLLKSLSKISQNEPVLLAGDFNTFSQKDKIYYDQMPDLIPFFRRLDLRWKSNRNLRDDRIDYTHLTKFEQHGFCGFNCPVTREVPRYFSYRVKN